MILRPVSPASPMGPPITKRPVGLTKIRTFCEDKLKLATTGSITCLVISGASFFSRSISGACCEEITTVSRATGLSPSYSIVT